MDILGVIREVIDLRSFSNLWYWIGLAVLWSTTSHWVLGVPYDLITRAARQGGEAMADLEDIVRVNINRYLYVGRLSGHWLLLVGMMSLTGLAITGWYYRIEFAQAVFLLLLPMLGVGAVTLRRAAILEAQKPTGEDLCRELHRHRVHVQGIGILAIFVTAMWGMYMNLFVGPFGAY